MTEKTIDIEKVIRKSKSKVIRSLPGFIVRLIIKIIHQDDMNTAINRDYEKTGIPFVNGLLEGWNVKVVVKDGGKIPPSGRFVFVANHPVGAMDSLAFLSMINKFHPDVISPSNELFNNIPQLRPVILGVNVFGKNTRETAEKLNDLFDSDSQIMIFPSGEVSRRKKGEISDPQWQKTFISKAIRHKRDIIPVHISGRNSNLFYFVANTRKLLGIRMYLETVLLPREMMKQRNSSFVLTVGEPIPWQTFTPDKSQNHWADFVREKVYKIQQNKGLTGT